MPATCSRDCHWRSSRRTGAPLCAAELTTTIRAPRSAICVRSRNASRKWPRWLVANRTSSPFGEVRVRGLGHPGVRDQQVDRPGDRVGERRHRVELAQVESARTRSSPVASGASSRATASPASTSRTPSTTSAPAMARARAVSTPMPDDAPVSTASRPRRSAVRATSSAVVSHPKRLVAPGSRSARPGCSPTSAPACRSRSRRPTCTGRWPAAAGSRRPCRRRPAAVAHHVERRQHGLARGWSRSARPRSRG